MLKNRFKDEIVEPSVTVKKIKGKARVHLCFWAFLFVVSGLMYWASLFTVVDLPTLSSIAQSSPISLELTVKTPSSSIDGAFDTVTSSLFSEMDSFLFPMMKLMSVIMLIIGFAAFVFNRNVMLLVMSMSLAGVLNLAPVLLGTDSEVNGSSASSPVAEKIELSGFIKSGDVRGFLEGVEKYSERGGFILNETIKSSNANQDDALNLLDIFSTDDAQKVSVGFAETVANAISNGDTTLHNSTQNVSALSAYVLSSVGQEDSKPVIDSRTGFAIFEAAKEREGFHMSNLYSNAVTAKVTSQAKVRNFLINTSAILLALGFVFLWLWGVSFRNVHRAEKVFIEEEKLRNVR
ncbi:TPA: hypothetical protein ACXNKZ_003837 [Klebsiella pneumoniae]|uniref:hypothetical protein n=1 Tax=Enterobacteriaceae TaxID=543 RepID=UPI000F5D6188|nr:MULTISPECIES: hypothetical protein [Enterobacteriaceae]HCM5085318.1 hypothetical protein [Klebsiella aerogenes]MBL1695001.1 hypothetical protein [Klebsiella pneumoniae]MBL2251570.1 hypothetical protein [Klebsiella pneumoniae]MCB3249022.1 hypothetical protein [Klebsiella pneumoniae]MCB3249254.1 hypothetical protein [Klebsiella pneumoniae]